MTYLLYQSVDSAGFSIIMNALTATQAVVNFDGTKLTRWYATALWTNGLESVPSNTLTNLPVVPPLPGLTFAASAGVIDPPFFVNGAVVQQNVNTTPLDGGRAGYLFSITNAGSYTVVAQVNAPDGASDSFFVNIDAEPTEANIWDIPNTLGIETRTVQWRGETNDHLFVLTKALHTLIFRGREAGTQVASITVTPKGTPPQPPAPPTNLRAVSVGLRRYDLQWEAPPLASTEVEQSIKAQPFVNIAKLPPGTMHLTLALAKRREYQFRARCVNAVGSSPYGNVISVTPN